MEFENEIEDILPIILGNIYRSKADNKGYTLRAPTKSTRASKFLRNI